MTPDAQFDFRRWWPETAESPLHYWTSLSPFAPVIGVRWRFAVADSDAFAAESPADFEAAESEQPAVSAILDPEPDLLPSLLSGQGDALAQDQADEETNAEAGALDRAGETTAPAVAAGADDLCRIKGIGAKMAARLAALGVARFAEIAAWEAKDVAHFDDVLAGIPGRIRRDDWVGQARAMV